MNWKTTTLLTVFAAALYLIVFVFGNYPGQVDDCNIVASIFGIVCH